MLSVAYSDGRSLLHNTVDFLFGKFYLFKLYFNLVDNTNTEHILTSLKNVFI